VQDDADVVIVDSSPDKRRKSKRKKLAGMEIVDVE